MCICLLVLLVPGVGLCQGAQGSGLYQLGGTPDAAASDGEARYLDADGIYCWWVGPPLRPGYFEVTVRARTTGRPGVVRFVVAEPASDQHLAHAVTRVQEGAVTSTEYQEVYCGAFFWDGTFPLRLSDWSSGCLLVDWVRVVNVPAWEVRDPLPGAFKHYEAPRFPAPPQVDGDLTEWRRVPVLSLGPECARSADYGGSADCSALARFAWDDTHLYLACEVTDDELATLRNARELGSLWRYDSLQVAFDAAYDARTPGYGADDYEYGFGLTPTGARAYRWVAGNNLPVGDVPTIGVAVVRDDDAKSTRYEVAIPFKELVPFSPARPVCGMSIVVNDSDQRRPERGWLEWTAGIAGAKDPSVFGQLRLVDAPPSDATVVARLSTERNLSDRTTAEARLSIRAPEALGPCRVEWNVHADEDEMKELLSGFVAADVSAPSFEVPLPLDLTPLGTGRFVLQARVVGEGGEVASARAEFLRFSVLALWDQLARVRDRLASGLERIAALRAGGGHGDYPRATLGAVEEFIRWVEADLHGSLYERATSTLDDLEALLGEAEAELAAVEADPSCDIQVPPVPGGRLVVHDGVFMRGTEPVLLYGYCGWWDVWTGIRRLSQQGLNHLQDSIIAPFALFPDAGPEPDPKMMDALRWAWEWADAAQIPYSRMLACDQVPSWFRERHPEATGGGWAGLCTLDESVRDLERRYLTTVAQGAGGRESTGVYVLYGENTHSLSEHPLEVAAFRAYLHEQYGALEALNAAWGTDFAAWEEIGSARQVQSPVAWHDRGRFSARLFANWTAWLASQLKAADPQALCTSYPSLLSWDDTSDFSSGIDMEALCRTLDVNGFDTAAVDYGGQRWAMSSITGLAMPHDMVRAFNPRNPNFDPELHLVNVNQRYPDEYIRAAMFQGALHGMSAAHLWVYQRSEGMDSMLVFQPRVMAAYLRACLDLRRLVRPVLAFQQAPAQVAILYSLTSVAYDARHLPQMRSLYEGTFFSDLKVGFVTERTVLEGALTGLKILLIPAAGHVPQPVAQAIVDWARAGGRLVLCGECLKSDAQNRPLPSLPQDCNPIVLPDSVDPIAYRVALEPIFAGAGVSRPLRAVSPDGTPLEGVELRTAQTAAGRLVYAINMNKTAVALDLWPRPDRIQDLLSDTALALPVTLPSLGVLMASWW